jgi:excisionase family DNA binding protein
MIRSSLKSAATGSPAGQNHHAKDLVICITLTTPYPHKSRKLRHFIAFPIQSGEQGGNRGKQCGTVFVSKSFQAIYYIVGFANSSHLKELNMNKERLLSVAEICQYLGLSRDTVYKWIETKGLPAYRLGRLWKFKKEDVDNWLEQNAS